MLGQMSDGIMPSYLNQVTTIFAFALCMYGGIAVLWLLYFTLRKHVADSFLKVCYVGMLMATFASMSIGMHILNKSVVGSLKAPVLVAVIQMAMAVVIVSPMTISQWSKLSLSTIGKWMVVPFLFAGMLCSATYTYRFISLSLLTLVRNLMPFIVLPTEYLCMPPEKQPHVSLQLFGTLVIMLVGTVIYAEGLHGLSWVGVGFAVLNMVLAMCDRLTQRYLLTGPCKEIPSSVCTVLNNGIGMIPSTALAAATMQLSHLSESAYSDPWKNPMTLILLVFSGLVGVGICYVSLELQREISASSFTVLQNVAKVAVVIVGIVIFGDPIRSARSILGLLLSLGGCMAYGYVTLNAARKPEPEKTPLIGAERREPKP